jgi:Domain of unknown function (DUF6894)
MASSPWDENMTHVFFHCASAERVLLDQNGSDVEDLVEAHERAKQIVREFITSGTPDDWRTWTMHVSDENGEDIFLMPFAYVLGRPH